MSDLIARSTIAAAIKEIRKDARDYPQWTDKLSNVAIKEKAYNTVLPAYAWPGGYDLLYYVSDDDQLTGDVLCSGCARTDMQTKNCQGFIVQSSDGCEEDVYCDQCGGQLVEAYEEETPVLVSDAQAEYDDYHCIDYSAFAKH